MQRVAPSLNLLSRSPAVVLLLYTAQYRIIAHVSLLFSLFGTLPLRQGARRKDPVQKLQYEHSGLLTDPNRPRDVTLACHGFFLVFPSKAPRAPVATSIVRALAEPQQLAAKKG